MVQYISFGGRIYRKTAFYAYLRRMLHLQSLVILANITLFNWVMYFPFVNAFFPSKFSQI